MKNNCGFGNESYDALHQGIHSNFEIIPCVQTIQIVNSLQLAIRMDILLIQIYIMYILLNYQHIYVIPKVIEIFHFHKK